jgi:AraC-like DNA-binding protein
MALTEELSRPGDPRGLSRRAFIRARRYMEEHIGEPMRLADIAAAAHLSRSHFARAFRISTGLSVMVYLRRLRIEKAKALLIESDTSIAEVSAALGFAHHSHFTRLFHKEAGMSPRSFAHLYGMPEQEPSHDA